MDASIGRQHNFWKKIAGKNTRILRAIVNKSWKFQHVKQQLYGARGVMVIVVGIGHGDTSSNPRPGCLHFT